MEPKQVLPLRFRVDLGVMVIKGYFTFTKDPEQEPLDQMVKFHIQETHWGFLLICKDAVGVFYSLPHRVTRLDLHLNKLECRM